MTKTSSSSVATLLAIAAFAVIPAAAQASDSDPHYYTAEGNASILPEGERVPVVAFGTLTLKNVNTGASLSCHNVVGGWIENPKGASPEIGHSGPAGIGATESWDPYECESVACTAEATKGGPATYLSEAAEPSPFRSPTEPGGNAGRLEWPSVLKVDSTAKRPETTIRTHMRVLGGINVHCHVQTGATETGEPTYGTVTSEKSEGEWQPWTGALRKGIIPNYSFIEFDNPSAENGEGSSELEKKCVEVRPKVNCRLFRTSSRALSTPKWARQVATDVAHRSYSDQ